MKPTKLTKRQIEPDDWLALSRLERWWVIWEINKRLVRAWLRALPQRWAERQLRR